MMLLNSSHMELLKQDDEDDVGIDDNCSCGHVNGAAADDDKYIMIKCVFVCLEKSSFLFRPS